MAEDNTPTPQRPIGIKPITIKPMQPTAPDAAAPASMPSGIKPIVLNPSAAGKPLEPGGPSPTIRLKPVMPSHPAQSDPHAAPGASAPLQPLRPPTIQPPSIRPSTMPIPDGAAKSKTSRISLDAALGEGSTSPNIHVGGIAPAPVGKITSNLTADIMSAAKGQTARVSLPLQTSESELTRRRTLRVKSPASADGDAQEPSGETLSEAPTVRKKKSLILKKDRADPAAAANPLSPADGAEGSDQVSAFSAFQAAPVRKTHPVFPVFAFASIFMIIALLVMYMAQACGPDRSLTAFSSFPDIGAPSWPGKILSF